ncbi:hypothetical protein E3N88_13044 [Mikania micrantha]|uniref:Uncharacterized protein n=1 Tax=Mikania micrantha TaxID=192012 RepID=A0A5N6P7G3_9ASTR|nr:hypothetical protein E3N88_13044 [Mikania micrantha]
MGKESEVGTQTVDRKPTIARKLQSAIQVQSGSTLHHVPDREPVAIGTILYRESVRATQIAGATIVDQIVSITPAENYLLKPEFQEACKVDDAASMAPENSPSSAETNNTSPRNGRIYMSKAQDVVSSVLAKGSAIRQDAMNKAKAFDEKHQLRANASARVNSLDRRVRLSEKFNVGVSVVNEKVKSVDQKLQVSDKTIAALMAAERKINDTGSAVKSSRYVTAGTAWLNGAFGKVAKAGQVAGTKTRQKWNLAVSNLTAKDSPIAA